MLQNVGEHKNDIDLHRRQINVRLHISYVKVFPVTIGYQLGDFFLCLHNLQPLMHRYSKTVLIDVIYRRLTQKLSGYFISLYSIKSPYSQRRPCKRDNILPNRRFNNICICYYLIIYSNKGTFSDLKALFAQ